MADLRSLFWTMAWMVTLDTTSPFLLDDLACRAFPPCTCAGREIFCYGRSMDNMPKIKLMNATTRNYSVIIHLNNNQLETLPALFFRSISSLAVTEITVNLQNNSMNDIGTNAFSGIEEKVIAIDLDNNNLTVIPSELAKLTKLQSLYINNNHISTLSSSVTTLMVIGRTLTTLSIDLKLFINWPSELKYLQMLSNLTLTNIQQANLDFDAFDSFRSMLRYLYIRHSRLEKIPISVCHLDKLSVLEFSHNFFIHLNSTWVDSSCRSLSNLSSISMEYDNLPQMPKFATLFYIDEVRLGHNRLSYIDTKYFSNYTDKNTRRLTLSNNYFKRIPSIVIGVLPQLIFLDMQYNAISSVEETDFFMGYGLTNLQHLILNHNPLEYISFSGFKRTPELEMLELGHTRLRILPDFTAFSHLRYLGLESNPTDCSCKISYLKGWNVTGIQITGDCDNSLLSVKSFIMIDLPSCH